MTKRQGLLVDVDPTLILIAIFCVVCFQTVPASTEEESAEHLYEAAFKLIVDGNYSEAYNRLNEIIARYPGTVYARLAEDRKQRLVNMNLQSIRRRKIDQSGRMESVVFGTVYSTWLGVGTARLLNSGDGEKAVAAGMMLGAPVGLVTSLTLTRNARLSRGQAALINFSGYWGTWQGYGWAAVGDESDDEKTLIKGAMAGGLLSLLTTSALTRWLDLSLGDAGLINYGGLWGTWLAFCAGIIADKEEEDLLRWTLIGGNVGAGVMASLAPSVEISPARANFINLGGIIGTIAAGGLLLLAQPETEEGALGTLMVGGILGLIVGGSTTADGDTKRSSQRAEHNRPGLSIHTVSFDRYHRIGSFDRKNQRHVVRTLPYVRVNLVSMQL